MGSFTCQHNNTQKDLKSESKTHHYKELREFKGAETAGNFGLVVIGFVAGVFVGYRFLAKPSLWMAAVGESFMANQYAMTQYREAEYPDAVEAIEAYIAYLDQTKPNEGPGWRPGENPWLDERGRNLDLTLSWIRLALLHERISNEDAAIEAWTTVDSLAAKGNWKDRSHDHLREVVHRIDGKPPNGD